MLYFLNIIRKLNEQDRKGEIFPILTWNPCVIGPVMRVVGPEALGWIGNIEAKELAERTDEAEAEAEVKYSDFKPTFLLKLDVRLDGDIDRSSNKSGNYQNTGTSAHETNMPKEIVKIQLKMHKMVHEFDGLINASSVAFEAEAFPDDMLTDNNNELGRSVLSTKESEVMRFLDKVYATSGKQSLLYKKSKITKSHDRLLVFDEAKFGKMPDQQPGTAAHVSVNLDIAYELLEVRTGLRLKPLHRGYHPKGMMEALEEEARFVINDALKGEGGIRKRKNIEELRNRVRNGVKEDGESGKDLSRFVEEYL
ncbi:hypothetical protein Clacol_000069 [Clathrus columnatus]|uniref:Uncharacterized protein n=1 Tax=Clathrus columnatus TaxID=1419009 RepID=A0AAV4ZWA2_9AGAM|nr:hypothetical protein Clacol_000069 [Clathrus columnatus]